MKPTTNEQFNYFVTECKAWIEFWGLSDWNIDFRHEKVEVNGSFPLGTITAMQEDKYAIIGFNTEAPEDLHQRKEIAFTAFHEICELLLMDFWNAACSRFDITMTEMTEKCHGVIARITNALFYDYYESTEDEEDEGNTDNSMAT